MSNKIINRFIQNNNQPLHGREITRILKRNQKTVQARLHTLEKKKIVTKQEIGKNYLYKINIQNKNIIYHLIQAEIEKTIEFLEGNFEIKEITSDLRKLTEAPILIFGSYAKDYHNKSSDLDILFLDKKKIYIKDIQHKYTKKIHTINIGKAEFIKGLKEKKSFMIEVLQNHILIQNHEYLLKRWIEQNGQN